MKRSQAVRNGVHLASLIAAALVFGSCSLKDSGDVRGPGGKGTDALPIGGEYYEAEVPDTLELRAAPIGGEYYEAEVPDTLDLLGCR